MKTEREQIKEIKQIIDERVETTLGQVQGRHDNVIKTVDTIIIAQDIIDAGYGDVSEYKAKMGRLQPNTPEELKDLLIEFDEMGFAPTTTCPNPDKYATEWRDRLVNCVHNANSELTDNLVFYKVKSYKLGKNIDTLKTEIKQEVKQAQIDVLNELNKKYGFYSCYSWNCDVKSLNTIIDEFIKEIQAQ